MAIFFHEGLPRSGKSYESISERLVPALARRRTVDAYIEGLDHEKLAGLAGISLDECKELLRVIKREELQTRDEAGKLKADHLPELVRDNSLVILDEAQNFWGNREKMGPAMVQFITEHGHRGIDIVLMGQDLRDVHATWRRRIESKYLFLKLTGLGSSARYTVTTHKHLGNDAYEKVGRQTRKYDPKYFGCYASHVSNDTNKADLIDKRSVVWNLPAIKYGMPLAVLVLVFGAWYTWRFFQPSTHAIKGPDKAASAAPGGVSRPAPAASGSLDARRGPVPGPGLPGPGPAQPAAATDPRAVVEQRLADLGQRYRIRLGGVIVQKGRATGLVEWIDGGSRVVERLSLDALRDLGVAVALGEGYVRLSYRGWGDIATMWPMETVGAVSAARLDAMRPKEAQPEQAPQVIAIDGRGHGLSGRDTGAPITRDTRQAQPTSRVAR